MKSFTASPAAKLHILRLDTGDDLLGCVNELIAKEGVQNAAVVSGIGTLDYCKMHYVTTTGFPAVENFLTWEDKPLELVSVDGVIAAGIPHLHGVVSDYDRAYSGHIEPGCRILYLGELVILEFELAGLHRSMNDRGIMELRCE